LNYRVTSNRIHLLIADDGGRDVIPNSMQLVAGRTGQEYLGEGKKDREEEWTGSIAVGNRPFVEKVKALLGFRAKGRKITRIGKGYQVREAPARYTALLGGLKRGYRARKHLFLEP
jgi:hypothetical protein